MEFKRSRYLNKLIQLKNNGRVKIITGIRRCGKTYLLNKIFIDHLISSNVPEDHILYLSFDGFQNAHLLNPIKLNDVLREQITDSGQYYIILDEIQRVQTIKNPMFTNGKIMKAKHGEEGSISFVDVVIGLVQLPNADVYISGSNSRFLSKDILTEFRDRGDEIYVQPLTFSETVEGLGITDTFKLSDAFDEYMLHGGFPMVLVNENPDYKEEYLKRLFSMTYLKDVKEKHRIKKEEELNTLVKVVAGNVGSLINPNTIENTFNSQQHSNLSFQTISSYLDYLEESFLLKKVQRYDVRGRKHIGATYKYYFTDPGLRNAVLDFLHMDYGHVMENIIYNELIYRGYSVQVGVVYSNSQSGKNTGRSPLETDFIAVKGSRRYYIQSAYTMDTQKKVEQERKSLIAIQDSFKKMIVMRKTPIRHDEYGITYLGIEDFLLKENSLEF